MIKPRTTEIGIVWEGITRDDECDWAHVSGGAGMVQVAGPFESLQMLGSITGEPVELDTLVPATRLLAMPFAPPLIRPGSMRGDGPITVTLYVRR